MTKPTPRLGRDAQELQSALYELMAASARFEVHPCVSSTPIELLGLDSLQLMSLTDELERILARQLSDEQVNAVLSAQTVGDILSAVQQ